MGTRCVTSVHSVWNNGGKPELEAVIYRHWDGYPEGQGKDLSEYLQQTRLVNGRCVGKDQEDHFSNGVGELASWIVHRMFVDGHNPGLMGELRDCGQEFHYKVTGEMFGEHRIMVDVYAGPVTAFGMGGDKCNKPIFSGTKDEFAKWIEKRVKAEEERLSKRASK